MLRFLAFDRRTSVMWYFQVAVEQGRQTKQSTLRPDVTPFSWGIPSIPGWSAFAADTTRYGPVGWLPDLDLRPRPGVVRPHEHAGDGALLAGVQDDAHPRQKKPWYEMLRAPEGRGVAAVHGLG